MNTPNFFIIGAPKCGTTALSEYLKEHPNIYISPIKEPHYFADDFRAGNLTPGTKPIDSLESYLNLFANVEPHHQAIGEASVHYLFSSVAINNIYQFDPQVKIIVMLRNPVDLAYSYHSQILFNLGENEPDFEKAWQLQELRKEGKYIPNLCGNINALQYREISQIGSQLERLFRIFPKKQIKVILLDDFKQNTSKIYQEVIAFLNLPKYNKQDFLIINSNKTHKSALIARLSQKPPKSVNKFVQVVKSLVKVNSFGIMSQLKKINNKEENRIPLSAEFRKKLIAEYKLEVEKVERLINRDLSSWKNNEDK